jgi:DNA-binding GntR family transcriptional regulator
VSRAEQLRQCEHDTPELPRLTASEAAYAVLRRQVIDGRLEPGTKVTEAGLAEALGISRTPVRDAIRRLIEEGLFQRQSSHDLRVAIFEPDEMEVVFDIRVLLESYAARRAALRADPEQLAELRELAERMRICTPPRSDRDFEILSTSNTRFHRLILEAAGSDRLTRTLVASVDVALIFRTYRAYSDVDLTRSCAHHIELVDAIEARAPDWAEAVMRSHLLAAASAARRHQLRSARDDD